MGYIRMLNVFDIYVSLIQQLLEKFHYLCAETKVLECQWHDFDDIHRFSQHCIRIYDIF